MWVKVKMKVKGLSSLKKGAWRVFDQSNWVVGWLFVWLVFLTKYWKLNSVSMILMMLTFKPINDHGKNNQTFLTVIALQDSPYQSKVSSQVGSALALENLVNWNSHSSWDKKIIPTEMFHFANWRWMYIVLYVTSHAITWMKISLKPDQIHSSWVIVLVNGHHCVKLQKSYFLVTGWAKKIHRIHILYLYSIHTIEDENKYRKYNIIIETFFSSVFGSSTEEARAWTQPSSKICYWVKGSWKWWLRWLWGWWRGWGWCDENLDKDHGRKWSSCTWE